MKYIRTKDMILTEEEYEETFNGIVVENQADTIEELCDEFVVYQPWTNSYYLTGALEAIKANIQANYYKGFGYDNPTIYGAIWTDKGLIYVAKMNSKGELELL